MLKSIKAFLSSKRLSSVCGTLQGVDDVSEGISFCFWISLLLSQEKRTSLFICLFSCQVQQKAPTAQKVFEHACVGVRSRLEAVLSNF